MAVITKIFGNNRRVRLLVGIMLAGLFCVQCTRTEAFRQSRFVVAVSGQMIGENAPDVLDEVRRLARTDHIALLEYCLANYRNNYSNYTCKFIKQERINGVTRREQVIDVRFQDSPFSVGMAWTPETAPIGDRVLYVEGKYNGQMLVRPKGLLGALVGTVKRDPAGPQAMSNTLKPITMFGFGRNLESLLEVYRLARERGDLVESFGGYAEVAGRNAIVLIRTLPATHPEYVANKTLVYIDLDYLVPICVEAYDWNEELACRYVYSDLAFNVQMSEDDFLPESLGMKPPK